MNSLIEQSQAYWHLGMTAEARVLAKQALALERDASDGDTTGPAAEWCALLAFNCGEFDSVATRGQREPRFPETSPAISFVALSLHYLGRHAEAVEALAPRLRRYDRPHDHYQMACFLAQAGRADEAVAQLLQSLPHCRDDRLKTWIDGDLKRLWPMLAEGEFSLETAHRLLEMEFDILRGKVLRPVSTPFPRGARSRLTGKQRHAFRLGYWNFTFAAAHSVAIFLSIGRAASMILPSSLGGGSGSFSNRRIALTLVEALNSCAHSQAMSKLALPEVNLSRPSLT